MQINSFISRFTNDPDKAELKKKGIRLGLTVVASLAVVLIGQLFFIIGGMDPLTWLLGVVAVSAWLGSYRLGTVSLAVSVMGYIYTTALMPIGGGYRDLLEMATYFDLLQFAAVGGLMVYVIYKAKKGEQVNKYRQQCLEQARVLAREQADRIKAQAEVKARDEFLSIVSHELKTPLTSMLLQIQIALHNIRNVSLANFSVEKLLQMLENVERQTGRLSRIINDLLNVSLITTGKMNLEKENTDLTALVKEISERAAQALNKPDYPLKVVTDGPLVGNWDKVRIEQAVVNLISNAMKYGNSKPVEVKVQKHNGLARLTVKDEGIGIPKDQRKQIFARFTRASSAKDFQGLGVGLYITSQIVSAHGGSIDVNSSEGKGSKFIVDLPLKN